MSARAYTHTHVSSCQLTCLRFSEIFQAGGRAILADEYIVCGERYQFAQLESNARLVEPSTAGSAQQLQDVQIAIFAAKNRKHNNNNEGVSVPVNSVNKTKKNSSVNTRVSILQVRNDAVSSVAVAAALAASKHTHQ